MSLVEDLFGEPQESLTEKAQKVQAANQRFQQELLEATQQVATDPQSVLVRLKAAQAEADVLQVNELLFLQKMGDWGTQQVPQAKNTWKETRLQILMVQAQAHLLLGQFADSQQAINGSRSLIGSDSNHPASAMLDEFEVTLTMAQG